MRESKVLNDRSYGLYVALGILILIVCAVDYYSPETFGSEWLHEMRAVLALLGVALVLTSLVIARRLERLREAPPPSLTPDSPEELRFFDPDESSYVRELSGVHCSEVRDPKKAFGFLPTNAISGSLYISPKRLAFGKATVHELALDVPLERVRELEYRGPGKHKLRVRFLDEHGQETTWRFHVHLRHGPDRHYDYEVWQKHAEEYLGSAKVR